MITASSPSDFDEDKLLEKASGELLAPPDDLGDSAQKISSKISQASETPQAKETPPPEIKEESKEELKPKDQMVEKVEKSEDQHEIKEDLKIEPKVELKNEPRIESKVEPKAEPKVEPKIEPKIELKAEPKVESKVEQKTQQAPTKPQSSSPKDDDDEILSSLTEEEMAKLLEETGVDTVPNLTKAPKPTNEAAIAVFDPNANPEKKEQEAQELERLIEKIANNAPDVPLVVNLTGNE